MSMDRGYSFPKFDVGSCGSVLGVDRILPGGIGSVSVGPGSIALVRWKVVPRVDYHNIGASPYVKLC
jgi:hypothetical protein